MPTFRDVAAMHVAVNRMADAVNVSLPNPSSDIPVQSQVVKMEGDLVEAVWSIYPDKVCCRCWKVSCQGILTLANESQLDLCAAQMSQLSRELS
jgi:hypothetical protein